MVENQVVVRDGYFLGTRGAIITMPETDGIAYYAPLGRYPQSRNVTLLCDIYVPVGKRVNPEKLSKVFSGKPIPKKALDRMNLKGYSIIATEIVEDNHR